MNNCEFFPPLIINVVLLEHREYRSVQRGVERHGGRVLEPLSRRSGELFGV